MLMQMVFDVQSFMSQGMALYTESRTAKKAWISAACALAQAKYLFEKGPADPDLLQKFEEAKEDESKKQERCRDIQERLAKHDSEREAWVNYLAAPSEPSAPLLYLNQRLSTSFPFNAQYNAVMLTNRQHGRCQSSMAHDILVAANLIKPRPHLAPCKFILLWKAELCYRCVHHHVACSQMT